MADSTKPSQSLAHLSGQRLADLVVDTFIVENIGKMAFDSPNFDSRPLHKQVDDWLVEHSVGCACKREFVHQTIEDVLEIYSTTDVRSEGIL